MNKTLEKLLPTLKKPVFLIATGLVGILLIAFSSLFSKPETATSAPTDFAAEEYRLALQRELCGIVNGITGANDASVVITLDSSAVCSYADEGEQSSNSDTDSAGTTSKKGYVKIKTSDGGETALKITEKMPKVRGVAVICSGGDNTQIAEKIKNTVKAALGTTEKRIYICGRKHK